MHELLKIQQDKAIKQLDRIQRMFWQLTHFILGDRAHFNEKDLSFELQKSLGIASPQGRYQLIQKGKTAAEHSNTYRLTHPLGEDVLSSGRSLPCPLVKIRFDLSGYQGKISVLENLQSSQGWLELNVLELDSFQREEHLVFSACTDKGEILDAQACERLFNLSAEVLETQLTEPPASFTQQVARQLEATLSQALEENNHYFKREQEKLETWADEQIQAAEQALGSVDVSLHWQP